MEGIGGIGIQAHADPAAHASSVADELGEHDRYLSGYLGKNFIGLRQKTLPFLDASTSGLRGLVLLSAAPNTGKTALAMQLGMDVVEHAPEACFLFLSLEMPRLEMLTRMKCRLGRLEWNTLVKGSFDCRGNGGAGFYNAGDQEKVARAREGLARIGHRIRVLDAENFPDPGVEAILEQARTLLDATGCRDIFLLMDYLQVWPIPEGALSRLGSLADEDRWRMERLRQLRDGLRRMARQAVVLVISESRTSTKEESEWAGPLADAMLSSRAGYTPDMVLLLSPMLYRMQGTPEEALLQKGIRHMNLTIAKGRDGVMKGSCPLSFYYLQSRFEEGLLPG